MTENNLSPQQVPSYTPPAAVAPKGLAIAALVVGIIAFLTGLVPILGLLLGAAGLALGIIALVKKQPKGLALTGTILSALAVVASLVATLFAGALTSAVVESVEEQTSVTAETPGAEASPNQESDEPSQAEGSRENPLPIGTLVSSADWDVVINSVNLSANEEVAAANMFNEPPVEGYQYAVVNVTVTYKGADSSFPAFVNIDYVTSTGEVISTWDSLAVAPEPTLGGGELYAGGTATGNLAFAIPASADGVLRVKPGVLSDDIFVAVN